MFIRYTHNWWHVALCYLEAHAPMEKVRDIYDECIWKELERSDAMPAEVYHNASLLKQLSSNKLQKKISFNYILWMQVYLNALGLLLRVYIRGGHDIFGDRLKNVASCLKDQVSANYGPL